MHILRLVFIDIETEFQYRANQLNGHFVAVNGQNTNQKCCVDNRQRI